MPNIIGRIQGFYGACFGQGAYADGSFYNAGGTARMNTNAGAQGGGMGFDASRSNPIYGSSEHVTAYNSAIQIWRRIS